MGAIINRLLDLTIAGICSKTPLRKSSGLKSE